MKRSNKQRTGLSRNIFLIIVPFLFLAACQPRYIQKEENAQSYRIDKRMDRVDPVMDSIIAPYKKGLDDEMGKIIGKASASMNKSKPESILGNWVADATVEEARALDYDVDFGAQNFGGLRISELPSGPITKGKIFELMPFENNLVILSMKGSDLEAFFNRIIDYGGWPISKDLRLIKKKDGTVDVSIGNKAVDLSKTYKIALPDYVANGGDDCSFFKDKERINTGILVRDLLIRNVDRYNKMGMSISAPVDGRLQIID